MARQDSKDLSDQDLLRRFAAQRDEGAFAALVSRHGPLVLAVGQRILYDQHAAEDVFQATFLVLAHKAASIRKHESLASWLYGVAYRLALRAKGQSATRQIHARQAQNRPPAEPIVEVVSRELGTALDEELIRLPENYRAPLILCYLKGKTQDEAASQLGCAWSTLGSTRTGPRFIALPAGTAGRAVLHRFADQGLVAESHLPNGLWGWQMIFAFADKELCHKTESFATCHGASDHPSNSRHSPTIMPPS